jgi:arylsulfatase A-like enzyme
VFAALTGVDKVSHQRGHESPMIMDALRIVDETAAQIRRYAESAGEWDTTSLWVVSDHGHSRVTNHEDLAGIVAAAGHRTMSHPWVFTRTPDVAVMVSGNAMAHLYVDVRSSTRGELGARWTTLLEALLARPSVDLALVPRGNDVLVLSGARGRASLRQDGDRYWYMREMGDPLRLGRDLDGVSGDEAYDATIDTDYPDGVVQIIHLAQSPRSGEIILSAARNWDFRAHYEPIPHVSSHGALHREHMLVPLLVNRPVRGRPRRTVDVMPSALEALGKPVPAGLDGKSFF